MSISNLNVDDENTDVKQLRIPTLDHFDTVPAATCKKNFSNAHAYHINSISQNSDRETFLSADDLRINLWNYDVSDQSFSKLCTFYTCFSIPYRSLFSP